MKKILAIVLAVVMLLPVFAVNVFAEESGLQTLVTLIEGGVSPHTGTSFSNEDGKIGWGSTVIKEGNSSWTDFLKALQNDTARFVLKYTITSDSTSTDYGWFNLFQAFGSSNDVSVPNYTSPAAKMVDWLDGEKMSNQWSLLKPGEHVVYYNCKDYIAAIEADEKCGAGNFADYIKSLRFQSGLNADFKVKFSDLYIEGVPEEEEPQDVVAYESSPNVASQGGWAWTTVLSGEETTKLSAALAGENAYIEIAVKDCTGWTELIFKDATGAQGKIFEGNVSGESTIKLTAKEITAKGFDVSQITELISNSDKPFTVTNVKVTIPAPKDDTAKKRAYNFAFVYINEEFHAYSFRELFIPMPHVDNGAGFCTFCREAVPTDVEEGDKSVFVLEKTGGQDYQDAPGTFADGVVLVDVTEGADNARIATNWVDGGKAWDGIIKAIPTEGAWLKITYTGKLNSVIFQTDKTSAPEAFETTVPAVVEEGEQNVAWFNCADIVANSPVAFGGDLGWANFMLNFEGETTVYGFEVVIPEVVPVAE